VIDRDSPSKYAYQCQIDKDSEHHELSEAIGGLENLTGLRQELETKQVLKVHHDMRQEIE